MRERMADNAHSQRDGAGSREPALHPAAERSTSSPSRSATPCIRRGRACERPFSAGRSPGSARPERTRAGHADATCRIAAAPPNPSRRRAAREVRRRRSCASTSCGARRRSIVAPRARRSTSCAGCTTTRRSATTISRDVTAVEYRDPERRIEVVWHLRSLPFRRFLRAQGAAREGQAARRAERVAGVQRRRLARARVLRHVRHPLPRAPGSAPHPHVGAVSRGLSRCARTSRCAGASAAPSSCDRRWLANPEARYSMEELSVAEAFEDLPADMRRRLAGGERTGE